MNSLAQPPDAPSKVKRHCSPQNPWQSAIRIAKRRSSIFPSTQLGPLINVWLKTLKASTRSSSGFDSVRDDIFATAMSKLPAPGRWKNRRYQLSASPKAFTLNFALSKCRILASPLSR